MAQLRDLPIIFLEDMPEKDFTEHIRLMRAARRAVVTRNFGKKKKKSKSSTPRKAAAPKMTLPELMEKAKTDPELAKQLLARLEEERSKRND